MADAKRTGWLVVLIFVLLLAMGAVVSGQGFDATPQTRLVPAIRLLQQVVTLDTISETNARAVCRVVASEGDGTSGVGSGTYLGGDGGWVLTAKHVVTGVPIGGIRCEFSNGEVINLHDMVTSRDCDSALLKLKNAPQGIAGQTIAATTVRPGDRCYLAGYDHGTRLRVYEGVANNVQYLDTFGLDHSDEERAISGNSGGPIWDATGMLVGNLYGHTDRSETLGVTNGQLVAFVQRVRQKYPQYSRTLPQCQNCPPNRQPPILNPPIQQPPVTPICPPVPPVCEPIPGPPGPRGPEGPKGATGTDGKRGPPGTFDVDKLTDDDIEKLAKRLPPFYPSWIDADGKVIDSIPGGVKLGQTLPLRISVEMKKAIAESAAKQLAN